MPHIDREKDLERKREYRRTHREEIRAYNHNRSVTHRDEISARNLKYNHGLTMSEYDALLAAQAGCCAICGRKPDGKKLHVDHDHACCPGKRSCGDCVRGLLCGPCNTAVGLLQDDPDVLLSAAAYLMTTGKRVRPDWTVQED